MTQEKKEWRTISENPNYEVSNTGGMKDFLKEWEDCGAVGEAMEKARNIFPELKESEDELSCFESALFTAFSYAWQSYLLGEEVNVKQWAKEQSKELLEAAKEELKGNNTAWSEDDDIMLGDLLLHLRNYFEDDVYFHYEEWLKSLRYQAHWKPSDEQIEALESATENCAYSEYQDCLRELIEQLKKLK